MHHTHVISGLTDVVDHGLGLKLTSLQANLQSKLVDLFFYISTKPRTDK